MDTTEILKTQPMEEIGGYKLIHLIGEGGMAQVWYAENQIKKPAAIKILKSNLLKNKDVSVRFKTEAEVMVKLNHPNIRQVYDFKIINNHPCIIMEYLEGADLKSYIDKNKKISTDNLKKWWNEIVDALNYIHEKGVVHRDIKPSNLFITNNGQLKVLDFGIAKIKQNNSITKTGTQIGTLTYMSPEQVIESKSVDFKSDYYSLGVTFHHLVQQKPPYISDLSQFEIMEAIIKKPLPILNKSKEPFSTLINEATHKNPKKRKLTSIQQVKSNQKKILLFALIAFFILAGAVAAWVTLKKDTGFVAEETTTIQPIEDNENDQASEELDNNESGDNESHVEDIEPIEKETPPPSQEPNTPPSSQINLPNYENNPEKYLNEGFEKILNENDINIRDNFKKEILPNFADNATVTIYSTDNLYTKEPAEQYFNKLILHNSLESIEIVESEYNLSGKVKNINIKEIY